MNYILATIFVLLACDEKTQDTSDTTSPNDTAENTTDADGDGFDASSDCDDDDPAVYPGSVTEASDDQCMIDADGDGYGDINAAAPFDSGSDCNDSDANTFPGSAPFESDPTGCYTDADDDDFGSISPADGATAGSDHWDDDASRWLLPAEGAWTYGEAINIQSDCDIDDIGDQESAGAGYNLVNTGDNTFQMQMEDGSSVDCTLTGSNFTCSIPPTMETVDLSEVNPSLDLRVDMRFTTTLSGAFSSPTTLRNSFNLLVECTGTDNLIFGCSALSDYLPCSASWEMPASAN
ncbi:MAG: hypothetical protein VX278_06565 [Myxococcota bacterium]|nr:hypothetical protein [Myxococcota bacterium]